MHNPQPTFGVIGLGKMGAGIVRHALRKGYRVVGLDKRPPDDLKDERFIEVPDCPFLVFVVRGDLRGRRKAHGHMAPL